ncbi:hypothetical protein BSKO_07968 [Bryopsis sp. KO-2023]|nr:hypothetical protein BSKO_07968 [Bryopsis sp. KO-2023]
MYSRLFEVSDEDTYMLVCKTVGEALNDGKAISELIESPGSTFLAECRRHQRAEDTAGMLSMFTSQVDMLFEKVPEKDAESCVHIISHLLARLLPGESDEPTEGLASALEKNKTQNQEARLRSLLHLYNAALFPEDQYSILLKAVRYATQTGLSDTLAPVIKGKAIDFARNWELPPEETKQLYFDFAALLRSCRSMTGVAKEAVELTTKALALVEAGDAPSLKAAWPHAAGAIRAFIRQPGVYTCDLAELAPVRSLAKDPALAPLYKFFVGMTSGDFDGLEKLATPEIMKDLDVTLSFCKNKMRMAGLLVISQDCGRKAVPYTRIQEALGLKEDEVESWVVKAIGEGLIDARLDQLNRLVTITRTTTKAFSKNDWKELEAQFGSWKGMLQNVEGMLKDANPAAMARSMVQG